MVDHPAAQVLDGPVIVLNGISSHVHILPQGSELKWTLLYYYYSKNVGMVMGMGLPDSSQHA